MKAQNLVAIHSVDIADVSSASASFVPGMLHHAARVTLNTVHGQVEFVASAMLPETVSMSQRKPCPA